MALYLPIVPSRIDSFDCLPMTRKDNSTDPFLSQTSASENFFKLYYNISPLNSESEYTHLAVRFLSIASNRNPLLDKQYPLGIYIAQKQSDSNGTYINIPAHIFIRITGSIILGPGKIPVKSTGNLTYSDLSTATGINEYYRAQIKLLSFEDNSITALTIPSYNTGNWVIGSATFTTTSNFINTTYISGIGEFSEWSSQIMMKPTYIGNLDSDVEIGIQGYVSRSNGSIVMSTNKATSEFFNFQFNYPRNSEEKISSYKFYIYDNTKTIYDESPEYQVQQYLAQTSITWVNEKSIVSGSDYYIAVYFKTNTGFSFTKRYHFMGAYSTYSLGLGFQARSDNENGRIEFKMLGKQVRFEPADSIYSEYEFINSDDQYSDDSGHKENALKILNGKTMKNKQQLIFKTGFNSWSIQMIVGGIKAKTDGPLDYSTIENDYMFKLYDTDDGTSFKYYVVPVYFIDSIGRVFNEFNLVKFSANESPSFANPINLNKQYSREFIAATPTEVETRFRSFMTETNGVIGGYAPINGSSDNTNYSSSTDLTNKYYLFFGEVNGKMFFYSEHLNPGTGITKAKDRLNS